MGADGLVKITFPQFEDYTDRMRFYFQMNSQFDKAGYTYGDHYKYEWIDTGKHVPDFMWVDSEIAMMLVLKYNCIRAT